MRRTSLTLAFVALLAVACGTEEPDAGTPEPVTTVETDTGGDTGGGGTMDDQDLDY